MDAIQKLRDTAALVLGEQTADHILKEHLMKKTVAIDLDGVLAQYDGWKGIDHIGDPIPGAVEFVKKLAEEFKVVIHTTRCSPSVNVDYDVAQLKYKVIQWLDKHGFVYDDVWCKEGKPIAVAYVDDRAVVCRPQGMKTDEDKKVVFDITLDKVRKLAE